MAACVGHNRREQQQKPHPELNEGFFSVVHGLLTFTDPFISLHLYAINCKVSRNGYTFMDGWMDGRTDECTRRGGEVEYRKRNRNRGIESKERL